MSGFQFRSLEFVGAGKLPAQVEFTAGLNVLSGASDAGKSFIFHALDFMCGAATPIESIPEAKGYTHVEVTLETTEGVRFSLQRSVLGGDFALMNLSEQDSTPITLKEKLTRFDVNNISTFLLGLAGLDGKKVLKNAENELQDLSFRNLAHFVFVDEQAIIKKESPVHGTESVLKTAESNVFKLLLSGSDDALLVATKKRAVLKAELQAQATLLDKLIVDYKADLREQTAEPEGLTDQLGRLDAALERASENAAAHRLAMNSSLEARRSVWERMVAANERKEQGATMLARFELLDQHYVTDLSRLEALSEAGALFPPFSSKICPYCGAPRTSHAPHPEEQLATKELEQVREACAVETAKIRLLRRDLQHAVEKLLSERANLDYQITQAEFALAQIAAEIRGVLAAELESAERELRTLGAKRYEVQTALSLRGRIGDLEERYSAVQGALASASAIKPVRADLPPASIEALRKAFAEVLSAWTFPVDGAVSFDTKGEDFIVGSRRRREQGKGSRALTHAAFNVAIMDACRDLQLAHPGFLAMDSPLVTFRDADVDGNLPEDAKAQVKDAFYEDLAVRAGKRQIIVFENEEPRPALASKINFLHFTGDSNIGRKGFFPASAHGSTANETFVSS